MFCPSVNDWRSQLEAQSRNTFRTTAPKLTQSPKVSWYKLQICFYSDRLLIVWFLTHGSEFSDWMFLATNSVNQGRFSKFGHSVGVGSCSAVFEAKRARPPADEHTGIFRVVWSIEQVQQRCLPTEPADFWFSTKLTWTGIQLFKLATLQDSQMLLNRAAQIMTVSKWFGRDCNTEK